MFQIKKMRANNVIDFAAEELKKYLKMMMPDAGDVSIEFEPNATDGFRLGLLEDFNLPSEAKDVLLDDVIHVDTDCCGGILAGSNPRSVLFSVYRFLRENGCRWLYPGVDGEFIPVKDIEPIKYHKLADHRFRGYCNEGAEFQQCMLETIDFYAKLELNIYMLEFKIPFTYYNWYYSHLNNTRYRIPEPVSKQQVLQWKRQCEAEISKRGLQFHDIGHGWTAEPFGLVSSDGWSASEQDLTDEQRECLAMINGKRELFNGIALNTNLCMSNPKVRAIVANDIVEYAKKQRNVDYLHVWLADDKRNHCECEECSKLTPSDYYIMMMNDIDDALTAEGLNTRVVFISYYDTMFPPIEARIKNPTRFSLLYAPITRSYTASINENSVLPEPLPYKRNTWAPPTSAEATASLLKEWKKVWPGPCFSYEYHFWWHQFTDPGYMYLSRRLYEDVLSLKYLGLDGFVEDGSQRAFFPNGFPLYIYAETLMNRDCNYDEVLEDYFKHIYGEDWKTVKEYLDAVSDTFNYAYMEGQQSSDLSKGKYYNPAMAENFDKIPALAQKAREIAAAHTNMPTRPQTVSMRLLPFHADYIEGVAAFMKEKCLGNDMKAYEMATEFFLEYGKNEIAIERYYDHGLASKIFHYFIDEFLMTHPGGIF